MAKLVLPNRMAWGWLLVGFAAGLAVSSFWPNEPGFAAATDRSDKFAITTVRVDGDTEAVFVLDFLTGRLQGAVFNQQSNMFVAYYYRNVARDFKISPDVEARYAIISGLGALQSRGQAQFGASALYIAELSSGRVNAYAIPYQVWNRPLPKPLPLVPMGTFSFRERLKGH